MSITSFEFREGPDLRVDVPNAFFAELFSAGSGSEGVRADGSVVTAADVLPGEILQTLEGMRAAEDRARQSQAAVPVGGIALR